MDDALNQEFLDAVEKTDRRLLNFAKRLALDDDDKVHFLDLSDVDKKEFLLAKVPSVQERFIFVSKPAAERAAFVGQVAKEERERLERVAKEERERQERVAKEERERQERVAKEERERQEREAVRDREQQQREAVPPVISLFYKRLVARGPPSISLTGELPPVACPLRFKSRLNRFGSQFAQTVFEFSDNLESDIFELVYELFKLDFSSRPDGESGLHFQNDYFVRLFCAVLGVALPDACLRDKHDASSSKRLRLDEVVYFIRCAVLRIEEKNTGSEIGTASDELSHKMLQWSPALYKRIPFVLGLAIANVTCRVLRMQPGPDGKSIVTSDVLNGETLNFQRIEDRWRLVTILLNFAHLLRANAAVFDSERACSLRLGGWFRRHQPGEPRNNLLLTDEFVLKRHAVEQPLLAQFYKDCAGVENLERLVGARNLTDFEVAPIGVPTRHLDETESLRAVLTIARVLESIHARGWCHNDVRWPNVLFDLDAGRHFLIDCEFARRIGGEWPAVELQVCDPVRGVAVERSSDMYMLGKLIDASACAALLRRVVTALIGVDKAARQVAFTQLCASSINGDGRRDGPAFN
jgi:hypothetical protein